MGRDDNGVTFVEVADQVEQQLPSGARERQIFKLIEHRQVEPRELSRQGPPLSIRVWSLRHLTRLEAILPQSRSLRREQIPQFALEYLAASVPLKRLITNPYAHRDLEIGEMLADPCF